MFTKQNKGKAKTTCRKYSPLHLRVPSLLEHPRHPENKTETPFIKMEKSAGFQRLKCIAVR